MKKSIVVFLLTLMIPLSSFSAEKGDITLKFGLATVQPNGDGGLDGALDVASDTQIGISVTYMLGSNLAVGLLASTPYTHDLELNGTKIGETSHLPPSLTLQYHFNSEGSVRPYIGAGINYTIFFDEKSTLGDLSLDNSIGLALEGGIDFEINDKWGINVSVWNMDIDTDAKLNGAELDTVEIDPWAYMIGATYNY